MLFGKRRTAQLPENDPKDMEPEAIQVVDTWLRGTRFIPFHADIAMPEEDSDLAVAARFSEGKWVFDKFSRFHEHLEKFTEDGSELFIGPWILERHGEPFSRYDYEHGPVTGVNFDVYYHSEKLGGLCFQPVMDNGKVPEGFLHGLVRVKISSSAALPYDHVFGLLNAASEPFQYDDNGLPSDQRLLKAFLKLQKVEWEARRKRTTLVDLDHVHSGFIWARSVWD
ncbi:hypothetical protein [Tateyamaria pelophila]|uniref:hypothetical protein n=1 Tax=Tateyamaria pelophila TaxID=328415 RepID=UPI001CBEFF46|nr:hypothetical protein [Tateyamaria pelophila]